jgi:hypothetical protein
MNKETKNKKDSNVVILKPCQRPQKKTEIIRLYSTHEEAQFLLKVLNIKDYNKQQLHDATQFIKQWLSGFLNKNEGFKSLIMRLALITNQGEAYFAYQFKLTRFGLLSKQGA